MFECIIVYLSCGGKGTRVHLSCGERVRGTSLRYLSTSLSCRDRKLALKKRKAGIG